MVFAKYRHESATGAPMSPYPEPPSPLPPHNFTLTKKKKKKLASELFLSQQRRIGALIFIPTLN